MDQFKKCSKCGIEKLLDYFYISGIQRKSWCKKCESDYAKSKWQEIYNRPGYKQSRKRYFLKWKYGITLEEFDLLFISQGRKCAVCYATEPGGKGSWHVDHDHKSETVRGILCQACNFMLGQAKDRPEVLRKGAEYLEKVEENL